MSTDTPIRLHLNKYSINVSTASGRAEYEKVCTAASALGHKIFNVLTMRGDYTPPDDVILETEHLFDNQMNASGHRVFDWYEGIVPNRSIKRGYYLTGDIDRLNALRSERYQCGYCGHQHRGHNAPLYCDKCLGSEYLKESDLPLLVMQPIRGPKRDASSGPDKAAYQAAQAAANAKRKELRIARLKADADKEIENAKAKCEQVMYEAEGKAAAMRAGLDTGNLIYYSHTKKWVWGWYKPLTVAESEEIRSVDLPFDYECKMQDGTIR